MVGTSFKKEWYYVSLTIGKITSVKMAFLFQTWTQPHQNYLAPRLRLEGGTDHGHCWAQGICFSPWSQWKYQYYITLSSWQQWQRVKSYFSIMEVCAGDSCIWRYVNCISKILLAWKMKSVQRKKNSNWLIFWKLGLGSGLLETHNLILSFQLQN